MKSINCDVARHVILLPVDTTHVPQLRKCPGGRSSDTPDCLHAAGEFPVRHILCVVIF
jgi:hypothetical protein